MTHDETTTGSELGERVTGDQGAEVADLIERIRRVNEYTARGVDGLIARDVLGWLPYFDLHGDDLLMWPASGGHWHRPDDPCDSRHSVSPERNPDPPYFTSSIDAALTLVPEGFAIRDFTIWPGHPPSLTLLGTRKIDGQYWNYSQDGRWDAKAATPALAICIAALKARDAQRKAGDR